MLEMVYVCLDTTNHHGHLPTGAIVREEWVDSGASSFSPSEDAGERGEGKREGEGMVLPTLVMAVMSNPFLVSFSHFPLVCVVVFALGGSIGELGAKRPRSALVTEASAARSMVTVMEEEEEEEEEEKQQIYFWGG